MSQSSFGLVRSGIRDIRSRLRDVSIIVALWYLPVTALQFIYNHWSFRDLYWRLDPIVNYGLFRPLLIIVSITAVDFFLNLRAGTHERNSVFRPRPRAWFMGLGAYLIVVAGALPAAVVRTVTEGPVLWLFPFQFLAIVVSFAGFLVIPIALIERKTGTAAFKRSWSLIRSQIDLVIVTAVVVRLVTLLLGVPHFALQLGGFGGGTMTVDVPVYLLLSYPMGFGFVLSELVATRLYQQLRSREEITDPNRDAAP